MPVENELVLKEIAFFRGSIKDMLAGPFGWFYEFGRKGPDHKNPETKAFLNAEMAHHVGGMMVLTMFSIRDEELSDPVRQKFEGLFEPEEKERYEAFLHIRNSFGHKFGGSRAARRRGAFDAVIAGPEPFGGIVEHTADKIRVNSEIARECQNFLFAMTEATFRRFSKAIAPAP